MNASFMQQEMLSALNLQPWPALLLGWLWPHRPGASARTMRKLHVLWAPDFFPPELPNTLIKSGIQWTRSGFSKDWSTEEPFVLVSLTFRWLLLKSTLEIKSILLQSP